MRIPSVNNWRGHKRGKRYQQQVTLREILWCQHPSFALILRSFQPSHPVKRLRASCQRCHLHFFPSLSIVESASAHSSDNIPLIHHNRCRHYSPAFTNECCDAKCLSIARSILIPLWRKNCLRYERSCLILSHGGFPHTKNRLRSQKICHVGRFNWLRSAPQKDLIQQASAVWTHPYQRFALWAYSPF